MLYIDNKKFQITEQTISVGNYFKNREEGYNINIHLSFINIETKVKGYLDLDVGFEKDSNINNFLNREYKGNVFQFDNDVYLEVFDTEKILDSEIESDIIVELKDKIGNKIETILKVDDKLIKIKYTGFLNIIESMKNYNENILYIKNNENWALAQEYTKDEEW